MELIEIELEGFAKFDASKTIHFKKGINFIAGLNEAGKSTLIEGIVASIFKFSKRNIEPFFSWGNTDACRVALVYKTDKGETFRITSDYKNNIRRLEKMKNSTFKEISTIDKIINQYLKKHFGFDDKKVFENTAFIRQSQIAILGDKVTKNKIKDMIEEVFAGRAQASATRAVKKIKKYSKDTAKEVDELKDKQVELKEKLQHSRETKANLNRNSDKLESISKVLEEKKIQLEKLEKHKALFDQKENLLKEKKYIEDKINDADEWLATYREHKQNEQVEEKNKFLPVIMILISVPLFLTGIWMVGLGSILLGVYLLLKKQPTPKQTKSDVSQKVTSKNNEKQDYINQKAVLEERLKKYRLVNFNIEDFDTLENLKDEVEQLKAQKIELKTTVKTTTSLVESPEEIQEELFAVESNIEKLKNRIHEHNLASRFLESATTEVHHKFTPLVEKTVKPLLKQVTNKHYENIRIDEESLDIGVKSPETKDYVNLSLLSQGARDQIYFALRTSMVNLLSGNLNIPLILDDPFHNFDQPRLEKTIDAISKISKGKQIILISHRPYHMEFKDFVDNVIELR